MIQWVLNSSNVATPITNSSKTVLFENVVTALYKRPSKASFVTSIAVE